jgi:hypothetical protein
MNAVTWCITSAKHTVKNYSCSVIEVNGTGMGVRIWVYRDPAPLLQVIVQNMDKNRKI